jgi:hypothetical protein
MAARSAGALLREILNEAFEVEGERGWLPSSSSGLDSAKPARF